MTTEEAYGPEALDTDGSAHAPTRGVTRNQRRVRPSLRPPTLMIDLLFGALMLFAFQMGDPGTRSIAALELSLPTAQRDAGSEPAELMPLKPIPVRGTEWVYEIADGERLLPDQVVAKARGTGKTIVLLLSADARVQDYIDAELPLQRRGIKTGLAVELKQGGSK